MWCHMTEKRQFNKSIKCLGSGKAAVRCQELDKLLTSLGFEVRDGKKSGHKVFLHHGISSFTSGAYTCGHGKNPQVKPVYVKKIFRLLTQYETEIIQFLGENS